MNEPIWAAEVIRMTNMQVPCNLLSQGLDWKLRLPFLSQIVLYSAWIDWGSAIGDGDP